MHRSEKVFMIGRNNEQFKLIIMFKKITIYESTIIKNSFANLGLRVNNVN